MLKKSKKTLNILMAIVMIISLFGGVTANMQSAQAANSASDAVTVAASQVGYHEKASNSNLDDFSANSGSGNYTKYARDVGVTNGQPWCTTFLVWCMRTAGISESIYPNYSSGCTEPYKVPRVMDWFKNKGIYYTRGSYVPNPGDYIILNGDNHVGMVEYVSNGYVHTVEGNSSDCVRRNTYSLNSSYITGYGKINYNADPVGCVDEITGGSGQIHVRGWAFDTDSISSNLAVHVYIGGSAGQSGAEGHAITANTERTDVNAVYGCGNYHGYDSYIQTSKVGTQEVHIYAINTPSGNNPEIGSGTVTITPDLGNKVNLGSSFYAYITDCNSGNVVTNDNTNVSCSTYTGGNNQKWHFVQNSDGSYTIESVSGKGMCLDAYGATGNNYDNVWVYGANSSNAQKWFLYSSGTGGYHFMPACTKYTVMDVQSASTESGANIQLFTVNRGQSNQSFKITKIGSSAGTTKASNVKNGVKIRWSKTKSAEGYVIYRRTDSSRGWRKVKTISNAYTTSYVDIYVKSGTAYYYKIRAYKKKNNKTLYKSYKTSSAIRYLKTPFNVRALVKSTGIKVSWSRVAGAEGYVVYRKVNNSSKWQKVKIVKKSNTLKYIDKSVKKGKTYTYRVRAYNGNSYGASKLSRTVKR